MEIEIHKLKECLKECEEFDQFGGNNHTHLKIMIDVIENDRNIEYIYEKYQGYNQLDNLHTAMYAIDVIEGRCDVEDFLV